MNWFFSPSVPTGHLPRQREARRGVEGAAPYILNLWRGGMGDVAGDHPTLDWLLGLYQVAFLDILRRIGYNILGVSGYMTCLSTFVGACR